MSADVALPRPARRARPQVDLDRLGWPGLVLAVLASGAVLVHLTRGTSFWADEWTWIVTRRGDDVHTFLSPHNGHLSLVPVAIYRVMFAVFGLGSYRPYQVLVIILSLVVGVTAYLYARPRTGGLVALLVAVTMLFLGGGSQNTMWAFQVPWLITCAAGIIALMLLEPRSRRNDVAACILITLAICSTSLSVAFAIGVAVDLAFVRRRWRDVWIWAVPLVLYLAWVVGYQPNAVDLSLLPTVPVSVAQSAAAAMSVALGLSGLGPGNSPAQSLSYGWPVLVAAGALAVWAVRRRPPRVRLLTLVVTFVVFTASVSVAHAGLANVLSSRYLYVDCLLVLLIGCELAAGTRPSLWVGLSLSVIAVVVLIANIGSLRVYGEFYRNAGATTDGALAALDLDGERVPGSTLARIYFYRSIRLTAGEYFAVRRALGTPAYAPSALPHAMGAAQSAADGQLLADGDVRLVAAAAPAPGSVVPTASFRPSQPGGEAGGTVRQTGTCLRFVPSAVLAPGATATFAVTLGPGELWIAAGAGPVTLSARRFAATFSSLGTVQDGHAALVSTRRDTSPVPWQLQLSTMAPVRVCGGPGSPRP